MGLRYFLYRQDGLLFPQSVPNLTEASTNLYELVKGGNLTVYVDEASRQAVHQAVALETSRGWRIAKEKQAHRIDVVVALAQAAQGLLKVGGVPAGAVAENARRGHQSRWMSRLSPVTEPPRQQATSWFLSKRFGTRAGQEKTPGSTPKGAPSQTHFRHF